MGYSSNVDAPVDALDFLRRVLDAMQNPIFIKNERHEWILVNEAFCNLLGASAEELLSKTDYDLLPEEQAREFWQKDDLVFASGTSNVNEEEITDGDGEARWLLTLKAPFTFSGSKYLVGVITDITERKRAEAAVREMALKDSLTGLPNRRLLREHMHQAGAAYRRFGGSLALIIIDLDDFKHINDTLGHSIGDRFLVEIADRLLAVARNSDIVARLGGDEFAVLASGYGRPEEFGALAERLIARLNEPVTIDNLSVRSSASIGVAIAHSDESDSDILLAQADLALYASKSAGKSTWCFFEPAMQERACNLVELEHELHQALEREEFVLYYQPIVSTRDCALLGCEALIRWNHPERGLLLPGTFLEVVERNRLIVPLTFWTIEAALQQAGEWARAGAPLGVSVNLPTPIFEVEGIVEHVVAQLAIQRLPARTLTVEVTEGALVDRGRADAVLRRLRELGVHVAIDDFGAGHSSLGRLDQIPVDVLKIDRMFVATTTPRRQAILRATIELARSLELQTVVEGIESVAQLALASGFGANAVQGYFFAMPMPAADLALWRHPVTSPRTRCGQAG